jgi:hypothetical protein
MASSFASDSNNDFIIRNGEFFIVNDASQLVQNLHERLTCFRDDFFLDRLHGVPYFQEIFIKPTNINNVESILKDAILADNEITELLTFELDFNSSTRKVSLVFSFKTIYDSVEEVTINV